MKTDAEVFSGGGVLSDADVFGQAPMEDTLKTKVKHVAQDVRTRFGDVLQLPAAVGDMILGAPANLVGRVKGAGAAVNEFLQGGTRAEMEAADAQARNLGMLESFKTPFQSAVKSLTGAEHYDQEIVAEALDKGAKAVAAKTGGVLTAHGVEMLLGTTLDALGIKGISPTVKAARARAIESQAKRELAKRPPPEGQMSDADVFTPAKTEVELAKIEKELVVTEKQVKEMFAKAKDPKNIVDNLFSRAAQRGLEDVQAQGEARLNPTIGHEVGKVEKTRLNEARVLGTEEAPVISPTLDSALQKISSDSRGALTPEERIALQDVARTAGIVDASGKPISSRQGGFVDSKLMLAIAASTGLTYGAMKYIKENHPDLAREMQRRVRKLFGMEDLDQKQRNEDAEQQRRRNDEQQNFEDRLNNGFEPPIERNSEGNLEADATDFLGPLGVGMAVRAKGVGSWHPEAMSRLAAPLFEKLNPGAKRESIPIFEARIRAGIDAEASKEAIAKLSLPDRMIRSYLNKHAGTEGDPLKDVEVPKGDSTRKWGDLIDSAVSSKEVEGPRGPEKVWNFHDRIEGVKDAVPPGVESRVETARTVLESGRAITSYLSHVGDYLRQNVSPDKLPQYDLVRAVKETAANDARVAKEMERASGESTKHLPVYKDYGDGMKWVELKLPEKLTEEQAKRVREVPETEAEAWVKKNVSDYDAEWNGEPIFEAVDGQGKTITNSFTQEAAYAETAEKAWLAGRLAEEGNQLGHCVGGYCDSVASGKSKIYSLRDAKGRSHVTVEVEPFEMTPRGLINLVPDAMYDRFANETPVPRGGWGPKEPHASLLAWLDKNEPSISKQWREAPNNITQIKGKQNRAPAEKYLPYVQDFVRRGKWGEVGDLEHSGLVEAPKEAHTDLGGRFVEPERLSLWKQSGSIDPRLLTGIAVAGSAAAYLAENPQDAEALTAAGLLAGTKRGLGQVGKGLDYTLGLVSTRLGHIDPALKLRARDYERVVMERSDKTLDRVSPFLHAVRDVKGEAGKALKTAMLTGDAAQIAEAIKGKPELVAGWREVQNVLREFEKEHIGLGRFKEGLTNYFPRIIEDFEGLKKALGQQERTHLEETLARAEAKMVKEQQRGLTDIEQSLIVNRSLTADPAFSQLPDWAKARKIREVTEKLEPFYASPTDSLLRYISAAVQDAEMAKFFGRNLATKKQGEKIYTDVDTSIGNIVAAELKAKRMDPAQANELRALLKSRFEGGERAMAGPLQDVRNLTNAGLLGNVLSAATQIGDSVMTIYHHGLLPTLRAVKDKLTGNAEVTTKQFGLVNHIAEELGSARVTGKVLQTLFKYSGFTAIDQFAKGLNLNAALTKNRGMAQTVKGLEKLQEKYGQAFGEEFPALIDDLKAERMTERVKSLLFSELSDAQPITKMEMPQAYLDNPNGRILYQMKTYMLKQMDVIRRDAYDQIADGHYVEGAKNLVAVAAALSLSNIPGDIIKNWIKGRPVDLDKIDYVENLLRTFGLNRYTTDKMTSSTPAKGAVEFGINTVKPPALSMVQDLDDPKKLSKYVPIIGRTIYDRELGGNEAAFAAEQRRERLQQRALRESENPSLRDARRAREEARRRRKMEKIRRQLP